MTGPAPTPYTGVENLEVMREADNYNRYLQSLVERHAAGAKRVIDFGAGHSVFEDEAMLARAERALASFANVVLLLPSPDDAESVRLLRERTGDAESNGLDFHEHFVRHPSNRRLAKHVVHTAGRTAEETRDEIIAVVGAAAPKGQA